MASIQSMPASGFPIAASMRDAFVMFGAHLAVVTLVALTSCAAGVNAPPLFPDAWAWQSIEGTRFALFLTNATLPEAVSQLDAGVRASSDGRWGVRLGASVFAAEKKGHSSRRQSVTKRDISLRDALDCVAQTYACEAGGLVWMLEPGGWVLARCRGAGGSRAVLLVCLCRDAETRQLLREIVLRCKYSCEGLCATTSFFRLTPDAEGNLACRVHVTSDIMEIGLEGRTIEFGFPREQEVDVVVAAPGYASQALRLPICATTEVCRIEMDLWPQNGPTPTDTR